MYKKIKYVKYYTETRNPDYRHDSPERFKTFLRRLGRSDNWGDRTIK